MIALDQLLPDFYELVNHYIYSYKTDRAEAEIIIGKSLRAAKKDQGIAVCLMEWLIQRYYVEDTENAYPLYNIGSLIDSGNPNVPLAILLCKAEGICPGICSLAGKRCTTERKILFGKTEKPVLRYDALSSRWFVSSGKDPLGHDTVETDLSRIALEYPDTVRAFEKIASAAAR